MSFLRAIADNLRSAPKNQKVDRFGILSPLLATGEYVQATKQMVGLLIAPTYSDKVNAKVLTGKSFSDKAATAYQAYVKQLSGRDQANEKAHPFSTMLDVLDTIEQNLTAIEDNFQTLFGQISGENPEKNLRVSSLVVIGYLEKADNFCTWISALVEHLTADEHDMIPPFRTREMLANSLMTAEFAQLNLNKMNIKHGGLMAEVRLLQSKGSDLPLQTATGEWIDQFGHDAQFNGDDKMLASAALRNPILIAINWGHVRTQARIELLTARKEWLTAKVIQEQSKQRGLDENSPEYKKLKKITERYASLISKYEQQIERMRG